MPSNNTSGSCEFYDHAWFGSDDMRREYTEETTAVTLAVGVTLGRVDVYAGARMNDLHIELTQTQLGGTNRLYSTYNRQETSDAILGIQFDRGGFLEASSGSTNGASAGFMFVF